MSKRAGKVPPLAQSPAPASGAAPELSARRTAGDRPSFMHRAMSWILRNWRWLLWLEPSSYLLGILIFVPFKDGPNLFLPQSVPSLSLRGLLYTLTLAWLFANTVIVAVSIIVARRWVIIPKPAVGRVTAEAPLVMLRRNEVSSRFNWKPPQVMRWDLLGVAGSSLFGKLMYIPVPRFSRPIVYRIAARIMGANLAEARDPIDSFANLQDFFVRYLKDGARPIAPTHVVSPVDARVVVVGEVEGDRVEQVKGVTYSLQQFLGECPAVTEASGYESDDSVASYESVRSFHNDSSVQEGDTMVHEAEKIGPVGVHDPPPENLDHLMSKDTHKMFHVVMYLAPGDYHRIHSPADVSINTVRHFPGTLFPISPLVARLIPNLFALNERVVLRGAWRYGFFSLTAVGAYNVGSIHLNFDSHVKTNALRRDFTCPNLKLFSWGGLGQYAYNRTYDKGIDLNKGEELGRFSLGSTVVLVFEAPASFKFTVKPGDKIRLGQPLGSFDATPN